MSPHEDNVFQKALRDLRDGSFTALEPHFVAGPDGQPPQILRWLDVGLFTNEPKAVAEALSCASFLGHTNVAEVLLAHGVDPTAGDGTGMNSLHWAANRGKLEAVRLLLRHHAPLEARNVHGTTVLGTAVWSIVNEPWWPDHLRIIEVLLEAGARVEEAGYHTGRGDVDELLRRFGAGQILIM